MLRGDKVAVICGGGVISAAVALASARAGRAGGADSRGPCDRQLPQAQAQAQAQFEYSATS